MKCQIFNPSVVCCNLRSGFHIFSHQRTPTPVHSPIERKRVSATVLPLKCPSSSWKVWRSEWGSLANLVRPAIPRSWNPWKKSSTVLLTRTEICSNPIRELPNPLCHVAPHTGESSQMIQLAEEETREVTLYERSNSKRKSASPSRRHLATHVGWQGKFDAQASRRLWRSRNTCPKSTEYISVDDYGENLWRLMVEADINAQFLRVFERWPRDRRRTNLHEWAVFWTWKKKFWRQIFGQRK